MRTPMQLNLMPLEKKYELRQHVRDFILEEDHHASIWTGGISSMQWCNLVADNERKALKFVRETFVRAVVRERNRYQRLQWIKNEDHSESTTGSNYEYQLYVSQRSPGNDYGVFVFAFTQRERCRFRYKGSQLKFQMKHDPVLLRDKSNMLLRRQCLEAIEQ